MIVTCNRCPRQLVFAGVREAILKAFGWVVGGGRCWCPDCAARHLKTGA